MSPRLSSVSRRAFLTRTVLTTTAGAAAMAAAPTTAAAIGRAAIGPIVRRGSTRMRVGLAAYSMRTFLQAKPGSPASTSGRAMDLLGFIDWAATLDTDAVELTSYYFPETVTPAYLNEIKRRCHLNGLDISGGAIRNNFTLPPGPELENLVHPSRHLAESLCRDRRTGDSGVRGDPAERRVGGAGHPQRHHQPEARLRNGRDPWRHPRSREPRLPHQHRPHAADRPRRRLAVVRGEPRFGQRRGGRSLRGAGEDRPLRRQRAGEGRSRPRRRAPVPPTSPGSSTCSPRPGSAATSSWNTRRNPTRTRRCRSTCAELRAAITARS